MQKLEISSVIEFLSKECKNKDHQKCYGRWIGLGFKVDCCCHCHKKYSIVKGGVLESVYPIYPIESIGSSNNCCYTYRKRSFK
jgi:hypothetical protein